jgi:uncharacterized membrane protein YphA (DoxX/SURF4 family)
MKKKYLLQLGLAFTLLYAGMDSLIHTFDWVGFVPGWIENFGIKPELALHAHSIVEIALGLLLLTTWKTKWVAAIAALDMAIILVANGFGRGIFLITFRDVGLLCTAIYLALLDE